MTYPIASGSNHCMSNCNQCVSLQQPWIALLRAELERIPRDFGDGRPPPRPLRSEKHPLGLPELTGSQLARVEQDNAAASFVLSEIDQLVDRGGGSVRENPYNSLHWWTPEEVAMWDSGRWSDQRYSATH